MCFIAAPVIAGAAVAGSTAAAAAASAAAMVLMANAAIASAIVGVAGAGVSYMGQQQQASYQQRSMQRQYDITQMNRTAEEQARARQFDVTSREAGEAAKMAYLLSAKKNKEFEQQAAAEIYAVGQQSAKAAGTARVAASQAGVAGISVDALLQDFTRQELSYQTSLLREQSGRTSMMNIEREAIRQQQYSRLLGAAPQPLPVIGQPVLPPRPTFLATGLQMGAAVAGMYANPYFATSLSLGDV